MTDLQNILDRINLLTNHKQRLEQDYSGRIKGRAYQKKSDYLSDQIKSQLNRIRELGTKGNLFQVKLELVQSSNNPTIIKYTYFSNIEEDTIKEICKYRFQGWNILGINKVILGELRDK